MPTSFFRVIYITLFFALACHTISYADDDANLRYQRQLLIDHIESNNVNVNEVSRLIRSGVDLNEPSRGTRFFRFLSFAYTPLAAAVLWGHTDIVSMLLEAGADPRPISLAVAIKEGKYDIAKILVARTDL